MIKFSATTDFDFGIESVSIITDSRHLTKRASAKDLLKYEKTAGQTDLHIIAVGALEGTGYNRNGDCFKEAECKKNYHFFKKADRAVHRHHKNKPQDEKFGNIKAAAYNDSMKRIELIVGLDNEKCADILDEQEKKGQTNWSMASKQAYDICSWCGHEAKTDSDRCAHIPAKLGEINKFGEMCGMINPNPQWFEISYVHRPADRIGMSLAKCAGLSEGLKPMLPSDHLRLYTGFRVPDDTLIISKYATEKRSLLSKLAEMEKHIEAIAKEGPKESKDKYLSEHASRLNDSESLSDSTIDELRKFDPAKLLKVLAENGIVFNPEEFTKYTFGDKVDEKHVCGMKTHLSSIFKDIFEDSEASADVANDEHFAPSMSDVIPKEIKNIIQRLIGGHSLFGAPAHGRVMRITIIKKAPGKLKPAPTEEKKSKEAFDKSLAKTYAKYKLAALSHMLQVNKLNDEVLWNALIQNRG